MICCVVTDCVVLLLYIVVRGYSVYACCLLCADYTGLFILLFPLLFCLILFLCCALYWLRVRDFFLMFVCFVLLLFFIRLSVGVWIFIQSSQSNNQNYFNPISLRACFLFCLASLLNQSNRIVLFSPILFYFSAWFLFCLTIASTNPIELSNLFQSYLFSRFVFVCCDVCCYVKSIIRDKKIPTFLGVGFCFGFVSLKD